MPTFCGVVLPIQQFHHIAFQKVLWLVNKCGHALLHSYSVCFTLVCMWRKCLCSWQPYWDYFKANSFTLGALWTFSPIYVVRRGRPQLNQDKLFWKLPSPLIMGSSGVVPQSIIFIAWYLCTVSIDCVVIQHCHKHSSGVWHRTNS